MKLSHGMSARHLAEVWGKDGMASMVTQRRRARKSGVALESHVRTVHHGVKDPTCPACRELEAAIESR